MSMGNFWPVAGLFGKNLIFGQNGEDGTDNSRDGDP
jgi:hypothetical protein